MNELLKKDVWRRIVAKYEHATSNDAFLDSLLPDEFIEYISQQDAKLYQDVTLKS